MKEYHLQYFRRFGLSQYPFQVDLKYPKPGTPNPTVDLFIVSLELSANNSIISVPIPLHSEGLFDEIIVTQVTWLSNDALLIRVMNRVQDHQKLLHVHFKEDTWITDTVRTESTSDEAWYNHVCLLLFVVFFGKLAYSCNLFMLSLLMDPEIYRHISNL